ncbi:unnamed protein product [Closterium sp. NIES-53]
MEVAVDSGAASGAEPTGAGTWGAEPRVAVSEGAEPGGAEPERVERGGAEPGGAESGSAELSLRHLREWYARRYCGAAGAAGAGGAAGAAGGAAGAGVARGASRAAGGAAGAGVAGGAAGGTGAVRGTAGVGATGGARTRGASAAGATGGTRAGGAAGVVAGDPGAEGTGAVSGVSGGAARPRPYYVPLLQQALGLPPSPGPTPPSPCPPPVQSQLQLQPTSPLPGPSPYSGRSVVGRRVSRPRPHPPPVPGTHSMTLHLESDSLRAASPTVTRFLATPVTDPSLSSSYACACSLCCWLDLSRLFVATCSESTASYSESAVLQRFGFTYSSPQSTPLPTGHLLSAPPSDESVEPSGPYPKLVGCLMDAAKRVLRYLCCTSGMGLVLGGRARVVLTGHADASWVDELAPATRAPPASGPSTAPTARTLSATGPTAAPAARAPPAQGTLAAPSGRRVAACFLCAAPCSLRTAFLQPTRSPPLCCLASSRPACCAAMASLCVLMIDHEDRPIQCERPGLTTCIWTS